MCVFVCMVYMALVTYNCWGLLRHCARFQDLSVSICTWDTYRFVYTCDIYSLRRTTRLNLRLRMRDRRASTYCWKEEHAKNYRKTCSGRWYLRLAPSVEYFSRKILGSWERQKYFPAPYFPQNPRELQALVLFTTFVWCSPVVESYNSS